MSVFGSASSPRRPRLGPCLIFFPLRSMPVIASSTRITPITSPSSIAREQERRTYCVRSALWDYSNFYPPSNTIGRRHSQVQVRQRRLQWSGGRRRGGKRRRGGTTKKVDDASKPPTTLTLRPTKEYQEEARWREKAWRMTNDDDDDASIPPTKTTTSLATMTMSCQSSYFFIGFSIPRQGGGRSDDGGSGDSSFGGSCGG